jgi:hypothetical protein
MEPTGLTSQDLERYAAEGILRLPGAVAPDAVAAMADVVWRRLHARHRILRDRPDTWTTAHPAQLTAQTDELSAMASPTVRAALDQLLGPGAWREPARWGLPLVTMPGFSAAWDVPRKGWHLDIQATAETPRVARIFVLLADLEPGGGATAYVGGSHRLVRDLAQEAGRPLRARDVRDRLAQDPWFAGLFGKSVGEGRRARFMDTAAMVRGVRVRVGEMTGRAGDAWLMDPLTLHAATPNASARPRMMLADWVDGRP